MISHTLTFENLAKAPVKQLDVIVSRQISDPYGYFDDSTMIWTSRDKLMEVKIDNVGNFLGTATKKATVKLLGIVNGILENDLFYIKTGLYNSATSSFLYITQGYYLVDTIAYDYEAGSTTVTMYDHMWSAQKTLYSDTQQSSGFSYPTTIQGLATQMAAAIGVTLASGFSTLPNASYNISTDPYANISNATLQSVIQEIAQATGTTAIISDVSLKFVKYDVSGTPENLTSNELKTLKIGKQYGPVTSVILGRRPQNDNIVVSNTAPTANIISSINTTTNLITVTGHGLVNGNLVRIESSGTYPAPLQPNTNYFVYTNGSANTFALTPTYADGIAGTNIIDLTTSGSGTINLSHLETQEVQINNNQLLDKDRQTTLPPIYQQLVGIGWNEVKSDTVGLGWHEVGDVIKYTQGTSTYFSSIDEIHLVFAGSVKEQLVSSIPDVATINYQTAGGIIKTIYNTEIEVDKQNNEITSIVSEQDVFATETQTNFTELYQNLSEILLTIQKSGGGNLILNSVGFAQESALDNASIQYNKLSFWDYNPSYQISTHGTVNAYSSSESQNAGGTSGQTIEMAGASVYITQRVNVAANTPLSFGLRVKNILGQGDAVITLTNTNDTHTINIDDIQGYDWVEFKIEDFTSTMSWLDIKIQSSGATHFLFTDLRLLYGSTLQGWIQSSSELLATNVQFTKLGMKIFDNVHDTETQVTYNEFSTRRRSDGVVLFEADDSGVITNDLSIKGQTSYYDNSGPLIKQITIPRSSALGGVAFIKVI